MRGGKKYGWEVLDCGLREHGFRDNGQVADHSGGTPTEARLSGGIAIARIEVMARHAAELFRDALALPPEARAALIDSLIESLDETVEEGAEEAWRREIELRLEQIDSGAVKLISWRNARQRLRDRLDR